MPNWCENELTIAGPKNELQEFIGFIGNNEGIAKKFIPYPEEFKKHDKAVSDYHKMLMKLNGNSRRLACALHNPPSDGFNSGGYQWCCNNWGCKWDFDFKAIDSGKHYIQIVFNTPWSPPIPVILAMSQRFSKLLFALQYKEEGMDFQGSYEVQGGEVLCDFSETIPEGEKDEDEQK